MPALPTDPQERVKYLRHCRSNAVKWHKESVMENTRLRKQLTKLESETVRAHAVAALSALAAIACLIYALAK